MKHIHIVAIAILTWSPLSALETKAGPNAEKLSKTDRSFRDFAIEVITASASGDADRLKKLTVVGREEQFWKATKMALMAMENMTILESSYEFDSDHKEYERKGVKWNLSIPADGQLTVVYKIGPQDGFVGDEAKMTYMVAKTDDGWRVVMPTSEQ